MDTAEHQRLNSSHKEVYPLWKKWGPYVAERAWGTVREDYSSNGDAWNYFPHDLARSKAYRWGEDGLAGFSDTYQTTIFSVALWNEKDPILKERLFGLSHLEGNHGEDVKEAYFYLDSTPTHSYMKYLYKYPQEEFPYEKLVQENHQRTLQDPEYEIYDTGVFDQGRYFDVFIEYVKASPEDICIRIQAYNRGPESARLHLIPQLWFRNTWSWTPPYAPTPRMKKNDKQPEQCSLWIDPTALPLPEWIPPAYRPAPFYAYADPEASLLFTNNETNTEKVENKPNRTPYVKDAFHRWIIQGDPCIHQEEGTKAGFHYASKEIAPQSSFTVRIRLTPQLLEDPFEEFNAIFEQRRQEADAFYEAVHAPGLSAEDKLIQRQALAGMLWNKQLYFYNVAKWLEGDDPSQPPPSGHEDSRNVHWTHLFSYNVISMPDKWEYPWFAAWDLSFHTIALALVDLDFAKEQLHLLLTHQFQHPNGQIPAYEWEFSDCNPPVQAWALWQLYKFEEEKKGQGDRDFLEICFLKLTNNFAWWVNKVDRYGNNFFEGGFLGLDNISVIDRSQTLPDGGYIEQSDGTGWMGFFSLLLTKIALELAKGNPIFQGIATTYFEHFVYIVGAMQPIDPNLFNMWDEKDGFFYDVISYPNGKWQPLKVRSFVGIIPFFCLDFLDEDEIDQYPHFKENFQLFMANNAPLIKRCLTILEYQGKKRYLFSLMNIEQMQRLLSYLWNENEFKSPHGIRSLSKYHKDHPFHFNGTDVDYEPGEATTVIKGGNSNWRGPVWFPPNILILSSLYRLHQAIGETILIQTDHSASLTPLQMAEFIRHALINIFRRNGHGQRPVYGNRRFFEEDPYWKDLLLFYEYYHGETGAGLGASHQTGWSGLVANLISRWFLSEIKNK
ncbi:MGH1-like glycoside hydrolase domain-containing protein [Candidatus Protochlamydia phocaeensis]|uniref:MGH1-like glycoside hydrolase domain-containing protein n=1 Tax=Candidatus Protochlamydia phocaeensis TaxID=1414722 RepID=UPI000838B79B|nr:glucosidase [Candidatus Protochlamydia phocaeensis]